MTVFVIIDYSPLIRLVIVNGLSWRQVIFDTFVGEALAAMSTCVAAKAPPTKAKIIYKKIWLKTKSH